MPCEQLQLTGIAPLVDGLTVDTRKKRVPRQGRFEAVHDETVCPGGEGLGGYVYLGRSVGAVVAEGVIRSTDIPKTGLLGFGSIAEATITRMTLREDVVIAALDTQQGLAAINQDNSFVACT